MAIKIYINFVKGEHKLGYIKGMLGFLLTVILILLGTPVWAGDVAPVEIYAAGKHYSSIEAYKNRNLILREVKNTANQSLEMQEAAKALGFEIDSDKVKTVEVSPVASGKTAEKLKLARLDRGLDEAITDFKQNWNNPNPKEVAASLQLEDKIREAVGDQQDPVLLISDHGKMRILALTPQDLPN